MRAILAMTVTFVFVHVCWVFFRAGSLGEAGQILERMFVGPFTGLRDGEPADGPGWEWRYLIAALPVLVLHGVQLGHEWYGLKKTGTRRALAFGLMVFLLLVVHRSERPAFIYFQF